MNRLENMFAAIVLKIIVTYLHLFSSCRASIAWREGRVKMGDTRSSTVQNHREMIATKTTILVLARVAQD